ncbi:MAG: TetR family transcriptional regulator, partial [Bacteroidales bacterium]|nr:TetR family transcriptional regulator [Bacteroidales bacterium]
MSPRSAKQFDDIRKQKKELIMETALELFAENGFHATSM